MRVQLVSCCIGPVLSVQRHPSFPKIFLSLGDWSLRYVFNNNNKIQMVSVWKIVICQGCFLYEHQKNMWSETETAQFPEQEYINGIFVAVCVYFKLICWKVTVRNHFLRIWSEEVRQSPVLQLHHQSDRMTAGAWSSTRYKTTKLDDGWSLEFHQV